MFGSSLDLAYPLCWVPTGKTCVVPFVSPSWLCCFFHTVFSSIYRRNTQVKYLFLLLILSPFFSLLFYFVPWCLYPRGSQLPSDNLETTKREVEPVPGLHVPSAEEQLLGNAPALTAAEEQMGKPWFATHVVNHRYTILHYSTPAESLSCRKFEPLRRTYCAAGFDRVAQSMDT